MKRIYLAGPMGPMDEGRAGRVRDAIGYAEELLRAGFAPWVPHLCDAWDQIFEHDYEASMAYDAVWLAQCQAVFRFPGHSPGADREVAWANANGLPVFMDLAELKRWARATTGGAGGGASAVLEVYEVTDVHQFKHNAEISAYLATIQAMAPPLLRLEIEALRTDCAIDDEHMALARCEDRPIPTPSSAMDRLRLVERELARRGGR